MAITQTTFCSSQEACELLRITAEELAARVATGAIEAWDSVDGRKLILRQSVLTAQGDASLQLSKQRPLRVCLIEPDGRSRKRYRDQLGKTGTTVSLSVFDSVFDALLWIGANAPDLLIMDVQVRSVETLPLLRALSRNPTLAGLKIAIGTRLNLLSCVSDLNLPPRVEVFVKPIAADVLKALVDGASSHAYRHQG